MELRTFEDLFGFDPTDLTEEEKGSLEPFVVEVLEEMIEAANDAEERYEELVNLTETAGRESVSAALELRQQRADRNRKALEALMAYGVAFVEGFDIDEPSIFSI